jgi:hypothetical protein
MSEIKLNLLDSHNTIIGTVHGSTGDRLVAAFASPLKSSTDFTDYTDYKMEY